MHDKYCINYPNQRNENREPWGDIGGYSGGEKGGETQINRVLSPCPMMSRQMSQPVGGYNSPFCD